MYDVPFVIFCIERWLGFDRGCHYETRSDPKESLWEWGSNDNSLSRLVKCISPRCDTLYFVLCAVKVFVSSGQMLRTHSTTVRHCPNGRRRCRRQSQITKAVTEQRWIIVDGWKYPIFYCRFINFVGEMILTIVKQYLTMIDSDWQNINKFCIIFLQYNKRLEWADHLKP